MPDDPKRPFLSGEDDPDRPLHDGPMLDVDGRLVNRLAPSVEVLPELAPPVPSPAATAEPLELGERTPSYYDPTPDSYRDPPQRRRSRAPLIAAALLLGVAGVILAGLLLAPKLVRPLVPRQLEQLVPHAHGSLVITSDPPGASVKIGGQVVGQTPWAGDNLWGDAPLTLELKGYRPWKGSIGARVDATISATLTR